MVKGGRNQVRSGRADCAYLAISYVSVCESSVTFFLSFFLSFLLFFSFFRFFFLFFFNFFFFRSVLFSFFIFSSMFIHLLISV